MSKTPENFQFSLNVCTINVNCQLENHYNRLSIDLKSVFPQDFDKRLEVINNNRKEFFKTVINSCKYDIIALQEMDPNTIDDLKEMINSDKIKESYALFYNDFINYDTRVVLLIKRKFFNVIAGIDFNLVNNVDFLNKNIILTFPYEIKKDNYLVIRVVNTHMTWEKDEYFEAVEKKIETSNDKNTNKKSFAEIQKGCHIVIFMGDMNSFDEQQTKNAKAAHADLINKLKGLDFRKYDDDEQIDSNNPYTYFRNVKNTSASKNDHIFWLKGNLFDNLKLFTDKPARIKEAINHSVNYCCNENINKNKPFNPEDKESLFSGFTDHSMLISKLTIEPEQNNISEDVKEE